MKAENPMANMASLDDGVAESPGKYLTPHPGASHASVNAHITTPETSVDTLQQPRTIKNDVEKEVDLENADNSYARRLSSSLDLTGTTNIVSFTDDDPGNPYNWSSVMHHQEKTHALCQCLTTVDLQSMDSLSGYFNGDEQYHREFHTKQRHTRVVSAFRSIK